MTSGTFLWIVFNLPHKISRINKYSYFNVNKLYYFLSFTFISVISSTNLNFIFREWGIIGDSLNIFGVRLNMRPF